MNHKIGAKEDAQGYYAIFLNGRAIAYGLNKDQAFYYYRGMMTGIEETGNKVILEDSIFDIFHWLIREKLLLFPCHEIRKNQNVPCGFSSCLALCFRAIHRQSKNSNSFRESHLSKSSNRKIFLSGMGEAVLWWGGFPTHWVSTTYALAPPRAP